MHVIGRALIRVTFKSLADLQNSFKLVGIEQLAIFSADLAGRFIFRECSSLLTNKIFGRHNVE